MTWLKRLGQQHKREEWGTWDNNVKVMTSFALLVPAVNYSEGYLNPVAWILITLGALVHHCLPSSALAHDVDHWMALIGCGLILVVKERGFHCAVVHMYWLMGCAFFFNFKLRMAVTGFGITWMTMRFGRVFSYLSGFAALVSFILQRMDIPHVHSLWHVALASLGYFVTLPSAVAHPMLSNLCENELL